MSTVVENGPPSGAAGMSTAWRARTPGRGLTGMIAWPAGLSSARANETLAWRVIAVPVLNGNDTVVDELCGYCSISGVILNEIGWLTRSFGWPSLPVAEV